MVQLTGAGQEQEIEVNLTNQNHISKQSLDIYFDPNITTHKSHKNFAEI